MVTQIQRVLHETTKIETNYEVGDLKNIAISHHPTYHAPSNKFGKLAAPWSEAANITTPNQA